MKALRIKNYRTARIITSGYADRYIKMEDVYALTMQGESGETATCRFESENDARNFLLISGMDFDTAWDFCRNAERTVVMSGKIDHRQWSSITVTDQEIQSVNAYLILRGSGGSYRADFLDRRMEELQKNPIPDSLMAIVRGQVAGCDRKNTEMWGHKNGHQAALSAGCAID